MEILRVLVLKELKVKYKRSILGFLWSLVTPIALAAVYLFVFVYVYKVGQEDYVKFLLAGILPWHAFNLSLLAGTTSFVDNGPTIRKVYFPRILLPVSIIIANMVNFLMVLALFSLVVVITGFPLWLHFHWVVLALLLQSLLSVGVVLTLSVWNVYLRDIQQLISIFLMVLFFATPIVYDLSLVPTAFRPFILANPLTSVMQMYRAGLVTGVAPDLGVILLGALESLVILALGYWVFARLSPHLAKEV
ncbi:MAG: ABC transporter permease [Actinobacteria bacterium]|nr:ABC transporter permease [Actinomycetota bacterium]